MYVYIVVTMHHNKLSYFVFSFLTYNPDFYLYKAYYYNFLCLFKLNLQMSWNLNQTQSEIVAEETGVQENIVSKVINLFEQGNEVTFKNIISYTRVFQIAYVARYRVDAHKGLPCDKVRQIFEAYQESKSVLFFIL